MGPEFKSRYFSFVYLPLFPFLSCHKISKQKMKIVLDGKISFWCLDKFFPTCLLLPWVYFLGKPSPKTCSKRSPLVLCSLSAGRVRGAVCPTGFHSLFASSAGNRVLCDDVHFGGDDSQSLMYPLFLCFIRKQRWLNLGHAVLQMPALSFGSVSCAFQNGIQ